MCHEDPASRDSLRPRIDVVLNWVEKKRIASEILMPAEELRVSALFASNLTLWENEFLELRRGLISEREFNVDAKRQAFDSVRPAIDPVRKIFQKTAATLPV